MRRLGIIGAVVGAALVTALVLMVGLFTVVGGSENDPRLAAYGVCDAMIGAWPEGGTDQARRDASQLGPESRQIVAMIITIGKERGLPPKAWQIAIQAGRQESGLRNLTYGDRDSVGIFQIRAMHGSLEQRLDIVWQINWFYDTLLRVPGWERMRPGDAAQAVERSAYPLKYHRWEAMAALLVAEIGGVDDPTGCSVAPAPTEAAQRAVEFALSQLGKPYVWGATGPDAYDCSGLVQTAYYHAGVQLPRVSWQQWRSGAYVPLDQAQPGDLVFYSDPDHPNPDGIHHVGMYLGNGQMVEAPYRGEPVRISPIDRWPGLMPYAVRPGV
ncbi:MAG TPA: C40 family peptidase [Pseudonocardiaceae bacterium]